MVSRYVRCHTRSYDANESSQAYCQSCLPIHARKANEYDMGQGELPATRCGMALMKDTCPTKMNLLAEWQKTTEVYLKAVADLSRQIGTLTKTDYDRLAQLAKTARKNSFNANAILEAHIKAHGC